MIYRRILHLEFHWGYWPRVSFRRPLRPGDRLPEGVLIACETCSGMGLLSISDSPGVFAVPSD